MTRAGQPARVFRWWQGSAPLPERAFPGRFGLVRPIANRAGAALDALIHGRHAGRLVYVSLVVLLGLSGWAALAYGGTRAVDLFAADLATEVLGLIVTLVLVHRFLERQERALRLRGSLGALRRSGRALSAMVAAWTELVKGSLERAPEPRPTGLDELLAADLTAALAHVEAGAPAVRAAAQRLAEARDTLRAVVSTYGSNLDPVYLGAIDDLTDDTFLSLVTDADGLAAPAWAHGGLRSARAIHFERLLVAVDCHNGLARDAARLRDRRTAPRGDGYAATLPLDADLRVPDAVPAEWWSVAPRPASLRTVRFRDAEIPQADVLELPRHPSLAVRSLSDKDLAVSMPAVRAFPSRR